MLIKIKKSINKINRSGHWISNRKGFVTMERNERVDDFPSKYIKRILNNIKSFDLRTYPDDIEKIYSKMSSWLKINKENILMTQGADGALLGIFNTFADVNCKILYLEPSYAMYPLYCSMFKAKKIPFKVSINKNFQYYDELMQFIKKTKPQIVAIANPNQPIEAMLKLSEIKKLCTHGKKMGYLVVIDEAYYHFNNISSIKLYKKYDNLITVRTFSKAFGLAGLRIGYCVASKNIIDSLKSTKPIYEINSINIKILNFFLNNIHIMKKNVKEINESRKFINKKLIKFGIDIIGKYSNTVLIKFKNNLILNQVYNHLYKNKFLVRKVDIDNSKTFLRCTIGGKKITRLFIKKILQKI